MARLPDADQWTCTSFAIPRSLLFSLPVCEDCRESWITLGLVGGIERCHRTAVKKLGAWVTDNKSSKLVTLGRKLGRKANNTAQSSSIGDPSCRPSYLSIYLLSPFSSPAASPVYQACAASFGGWELKTVSFSPISLLTLSSL